MIREGGSASRVSINARLRDPGGGTVSTDPRRRIVLHDVTVSVEQPREEPTLVSPTGSTIQTKQASAGECFHDVIGLYAHKGNMWNADDRVPQNDIKSPYGGGVSTLPGAAGGPPPAMYLVASVLPSWIHGRWQSFGSTRPLQGILQNKSLLVIHRTGVGRWIRITH